MIVAIPSRNRTDARDRFGHPFHLESHGIGVAEPSASDSFIDATTTVAGSPSSSGACTP
jgi:hypothetical protein